MRRSIAALVAVFALMALVGCGGDDSGAEGTGSGSEAPAPGDPVVEGTITVFAAASLTDAFGELATAFREGNPDVVVRLNFGGSSSLREQILGGAPVDVFASANASNMAQVIDAGEVAEAQTFVTNSLQIVVPAGNPAGVTGLDDFADADRLIGLCADEVPCGEFGRQALDAAGVTASPDTNEPDVRSLLGKVEAGELDAGLVYVTDVVSAGDRVEGIDIPAEFDVVAEYPIASVLSSRNQGGASAFVDYVLGDEGQAILGEYGFGAP